ncbi:hypothetical protein FACS1894187_19800 [Synergistales bacterium]|nr:hypothetical protein FACS1894187_19800 [Synergistales bacterium]
MMDENRRQIYSRLVKDEKDTLGHIAYSLYKKQKIAFIKDKERENNGQPPTDQQLKDFQEIAGSEEQLDLYQTKALSLMQFFLDTALREDLEAQREEFLRKYSSPGFWPGVFQGLVASALFVILGFFILWGTGGWVKIGELIANSIK